MKAIDKMVEWLTDTVRDMRQAGFNDAAGVYGECLCKARIFQINEEKAQKPTAPASFIGEVQELADKIVKTNDKGDLYIGIALQKILSRYTVQEEKPVVRDGYWWCPACEEKSEYVEVHCCGNGLEFRLNKSAANADMVEELEKQIRQRSYADENDECNGQVIPVGDLFEILSKYRPVKAPADMVSVHMDYAPIDNCQSMNETYGEICVKCNKCGRFVSRHQSGGKGEVEK